MQPEYVENIHVGYACVWDNPPHRSHLCHGCGHVWRPADVPTNGVATITTKGKADSPIAAPSADAGVREALVKRITAYLTGGGLFNPELANHDAVRNLLMDCRDALSPAAQQPTETKR
jgi:hypothetical protein